MILKKWSHRGGDRRIDRCARVVVEIDTPHDQNTSTGSFAEHAAALLELVFIDLAAGEALFEDIERCAA